VQATGPARLRHGGPPGRHLQRPARQPQPGRCRRHQWSTAPRSTRRP